MGKNNKAFAFADPLRGLGVFAYLLSPPAMQEEPHYRIAKSMTLVNIDSVLRNLLQKLKKLDPPQGVELLSYKRNRSIAVLLLDDEKILVSERGYRDEEQIIAKSCLANHLKKIIKYEFPRSRKIRVYQVDSPLELETSRKKL